MTRSWDTPDRLRELLCTLVGFDSVTGTDGEQRFPMRVAELVAANPVLGGDGDRVELGDLGDGRSFLTLTHRSEHTDAAILLVSHFDTVDVAEYGVHVDHAFDPDALAAALRDGDAALDDDAAADLASGEWLFGRGTMDMKAGLALHLSILERAAAEGWPINLVLLTVPDEEVNSAGMRAGVEHLVELQRRLGLRWVLSLNGEPSFPAHPGDQRHHVYTGSIGKLLPAALCVGRETHAGTPLAGISSTWIAAQLTSALEWNPLLRETARGETTPLPVVLEQRDHRAGYSTQTTSRTSVLYNVFTMQRDAADVLDLVERVAIQAAESATASWRQTCARDGIDEPPAIRVLRYDQLVARAKARVGERGVAELVADAPTGSGDVRDDALRIADSLAAACPELAPAIVLLFAPPWYPAVCSSEGQLVESCIERVTARAASRHGISIERTHWFNGISDLSYLAFSDPHDRRDAWRANLPPVGYDLPFTAMSALDAPVLNVGPLGKDPHQRSERLHEPSAFEQLPDLLADLVLHAAELSR